MLAFIAMTSMPPANTIHEFKVKNIDGETISLGKFKKKVLLVVNVASKCGLTPQYKALQATYEKYKGQGFEILGFPANNFGGQEPGTEAEIKTFCTGKYNVTFPMFSKISVKGPDTAPLYQWLIAQSDRPKDDIEWNFGKFLVGRDGKVIKRFSPQVTPDSPEVVAAIEAAVAIGK
ncbi:MAG: glutathione peroxidase [Fimbriimonas sp.]